MLKRAGQGSLEKTQEVTCPIESQKEELALSDRILVMTSALDIFPDGFSLSSFIDTEGYSTDTICQHSRSKSCCSFVSKASSLKNHANQEFIMETVHVNHLGIPLNIMPLAVILSLPCLYKGT